jgi:hypothetical protein
MALVAGDSGSTTDEADNGILKVDNGRCVVLIGFIVDAAVAENVVSPVPGLLYDPYEFNGLFPLTCKLSFIIIVGSVIVSSVLKYELFNRETCGFCVTVNNGLDGCGETGVSDDCGINAIMDATCIVVDDGTADVCDVKGIGDEGFGDEDSTANCDDMVDKDEGSDKSGINDDSDCEDGTCVDGGNEDDVCNVVCKECKDCGSLWAFTELLVVCSTSTIVDDEGDSDVLLASELLSGTWVEVKVTFFVTCEWVPVAMSPISCVVFKTGTAGKKMD